ncbi:MAG: membrane associated heme-binding lipoprotein HmuY [Bacteroidetes bacterium HLUCCA01]|nr:MAG: membrane associated heme-binding lipoprotein HmuY [Bacteroidetes bacterium HLUCCA01]
MNYRFILPMLLAATTIVITACSDSSTGADVPESEIDVKTIENLSAVGDNGEFTFFSLRSGLVVPRSDSASANWDLAFRGTTILVNSGVSGPGSAGAVVLDVPFQQVTIAPSAGYNTDSAEVLAIPDGSGNGWYTYNPAQAMPPFAVLPRENVTIVLQTADANHFAKVEIISYYYDNPDTSSEAFANLQTRPESRYYTFRYALQRTEGLRDLN